MVALVRYPTSTAVGVALAVRAGLPIVADEALMDECAVADEPDPRAHGDAPRRTPIPRAFHLALVEPPEPEPAEGPSDGEPDGR